jgi:ParB/RepB/Spo0J family partition protein
MANEQLLWVPYSQLRLHPRARPHSDDKLQELMNSMSVRGQLEPSRARSKDGIMEVYIGAGRYTAGQKLKWEALWVIAADRSDEDVDLDMLHENLKREDLDPISEAMEYDYNMKAHQWDQATMAEKAGLTQASISQSVALLRLPPESQELIRRLILTKSHGVSIEKMNDAELEKELAQAAVDKKLSVEATEKAVNLYVEKGPDALRAYLSGGLNGNDAKGKNSEPPPLWSGLPDGVKSQYQGGWITLRWSPKQYATPKKLLEEVWKGAPEALDLPKRPKSERKNKENKSPHA